MDGNVIFFLRVGCFKLKPCVNGDEVDGRVDSFGG